MHLSGGFSRVPGELTSLGIGKDKAHSSCMSSLLTQAEANGLIQLPKIPASPRAEMYPGKGDSLRVDLHSLNRKEVFLVEITRGRIDIGKVNHQFVGRQIVPLLRLDLGVSVKHKNPDDVWIVGPHLHQYQEGSDLKWATPLPCAGFDPGDSLMTHLDKFFAFCNVAPQPSISMGLFS